MSEQEIRGELLPTLEGRGLMSNAEVEKFAKLLREWAKNQEDHAAREKLHMFLLLYEDPLINALRFYAADK